MFIFTVSSPNLPINAEKVHLYLYLIFLGLGTNVNTDHFSQLIPKALNSECQNLLFSVQIKRQ